MLCIRRRKVNPNGAHNCNNDSHCQPVTMPNRFRFRPSWPVVFVNDLILCINREEDDEQKRQNIYRRDLDQLIGLVVVPNAPE
jgi:hypothetical protein